jgi:hypothetical protein
LRERVLLRLPPSLAPGRYRVTVQLNRLPFMPNHTLGDYLNNRDLYSGPVVDTVEVAR